MRSVLFYSVLAISASAWATDTTPAPLSPAEAVAAMRVPPGFKATLVAAEPEVVQPIGYCFDDRGRLFVAEALNYGAWQPTGKDRIVILEDRDGDGRAETRTLFYEGLNYVTGIEVGFGGVWVMSPPSLYFIPDADGDDKPDGEPRVLFDGFGHKESRHNLANGFTWGPDGWLYAGHGRTSPSDVGRPETPAAERIHCDGGVYRIHPTRLVFENFADGTTNPWGVDFDDFGQCFVSNCVNPHLFHVLQGGHYEPWRNRPSSLYAYERLPTCADHLHYPGDQPHAMRGETSETLAMGGGHAHCGTLIYLGGAFPPQYRNTVFMCNVHGRRINNDVLERHGSGYVAHHGQDFMIAGDPWFMGVTLQTGPDGSVYVSDWSDTGECHTYQPHRENGRIYRLSHGEVKVAKVDLVKLSDEELVLLQRHDNDWHVRHARRLLQERAAAKGWQPARVHEALKHMLVSEPRTPKRLRALWALKVTGGLDDVTRLGLLDDHDEHLRAWAVQLWCENPLDVSVEVRGRFAAMAARDKSPVVRLAIAAALQRLPLDQRWEIAAALSLHSEDAADANLPLMDWYAIEPLVARDPARALNLAVAARIPLLRQFIARRLADDALARETKQPASTPSRLSEHLALWVMTVSQATDPAVQTDLLLGMREGLRGRRSVPRPEGWTQLYPRLAGSVAPVVREHAVMLALLFGDPQAVVDLRAMATTSTLPAAMRQSALEALVGSPAAELPGFLHQILSDRVLTRTALRGLASVPHPDTARMIIARYPEFTADEKAEAIATLASRVPHALALLEAVEQKRIPRTDLSAFVARQIHALGDGPTTARLKAVWGDIRDSAPETRAQMTKLKALLNPNYLLRADPVKGRQLFIKSCHQCHKLYGDGGTIGPDLTGSNRNNLDYLLSNILDPSAEVAQDYRMSIVETVNGRVITGLIVERTPSRIVLQTATDRITLPVEEIEELRPSTQSIMPTGQIDKLSKEEIRDLIGYLAGKSQVALPK